MYRAKQATRWITAIAYCCVLLSAVRADEPLRATLQAAIIAHGGEENLAKTLTGTLLAKAKMKLSPDAENSISWEETFELPRRYLRSIKGQMAGEDFSMAYAITDGSGWIRHNGADAQDYKGEKLTLWGCWNAAFALLPSCLSDQVKLEPGGRENVDGRELVGVSVSGEGAWEQTTLFFDTETGLLVKSKRRIQHPLSGQEMDGEVRFSDYREVSGVQYPHRIATYIGGSKTIEVEIIQIKFLKTLDDRLFEKP